MKFNVHLFKIILIFSAFPILTSHASARIQSYLPNGIAAIVGESIITYEDVRKEMAPLMQQITRSASSPEDIRTKVTQVSREILKNIIDRHLIVAEFKEEGLLIPKSYIENEYDDVLTQQFGGDRSRFLNFLKRQDKTVRQFRKELEEKLMVQAMRARMKRTQSEISPEKIEQYYKRNKFLFLQEDSVFLQQILLTPYADETTDLLRQEAENIIQKLEGGASFYEMARTYSRDNMRDRGGEWGWIQKNEIREELEKVAFALPAGSHSQPIVVGEHVFILYIKEKKEEGVQALEDVRDEIEDKLLDQISQNAQRKWVDRLRKEAYIKYF
jgi:peptidyl-prolyl cis-trans isomerase SurA